MRALSKNEIIEIVQAGRLLSDQDGTAILDQFEINHPLIYQAIYGKFSDGIAEENLDMANLFLDLCFDVILVYKKAFGNAPPNKSQNRAWFDREIALLDKEFKSLNIHESMNSKFQKKLSKRFVERSIESGIQLHLLEYLAAVSG